MARVGRVRKESIMDAQTGEEMVSYKTSTFNTGKEPMYVKIYIKDILYLSDLQPNLVAIVMALLKRVGFAGEDQGLCVNVNKYAKETICKEIGWEHPTSVDNAIQKLIKGKILYRVARGVYRFNPHLFGRGNWADISVLRMQVNYDDINGRTFKTVFEEAEKSKAYWDGINKEE